MHMDRIEVCVSVKRDLIRGQNRPNTQPKETYLTLAYLHEVRMCEVDPYFGHMVRRRLAELRKHLFRFLDAPRLKEHCGRPIGRKHVVGLAVEHVGVTVEGPGEILYIYI